MALRIADAAVVIVAQRASSIRHADQILVLEDAWSSAPERTTNCWRHVTPTPRSSPSTLDGRADRARSERRAQRRGVGTDDPRHHRSTGVRPVRAGGGVAVPVERSDQFGATVRRLGLILGPERPRLLLVLVLAVGGVVLVVLGLLARPGDRHHRAGCHQRSGHRFRRPSQADAGGGLYAAAWVLAYGQAYILAGVVQRTMYGLRQSVEDKLNRLPLSHVDRQSRGDLLSCATNDIDNLAQSLQQTVSQILTSLLTLVGVTVMMFTISPVLARSPSSRCCSLWTMKVGARRRGSSASGGTPAASTVRPRRSSRAMRS